MEVHLKIIGSLLCLLSFIHVGFPKYFEWKKDLAQLSMINREMMQVHTFFIALVVFLIGVLCLLESEALVNTRLGRSICLGLFVFWFIRSISQFFVYSTALWKGKTFETITHILFSIFWIYLSTVFLIIGFALYK